MLKIVLALNIIIYSVIYRGIHMANKKIILTIIDVYKGEKYTDTCLNAIILKY